MTNNKQGPKEGLTGSLHRMMDSRGDPDIGRFKRSRVERSTELTPKSYEFAVNRLTGNIQPECEKNIWKVVSYEFRVTGFDHRSVIARMKDEAICKKSDKFSLIKDE